MKTRLELAHDYAMLHMMHPQYKDVDDLDMVQWAHDYADAMLSEDEWNIDIKAGVETYVKAPNFGYTGNWRYSLRKRPK